MISLKESLLNKPKNLTGSIERMNEDIIAEFLKQNYNGHDFDEEYMTIKYINNETIVDYKGSLVFDGDGPLTNGTFRFGVVEDFDCSMSPSLVDLEGAPEIVEHSFNCDGCKNLKSLKGVPKKVGYEFNCAWCRNLKSLEGLPQPLDKDGYQLTCSGCKSLKNLKGCPKYLKSLSAHESRLESLE